MLTLRSCVRALVACSVILFMVDVFSPCCAHPRHSAEHPHMLAHPHRRPHAERRRVGPEVVRTRWRRGHASRRSRKSRHRKLTKHHRRRYDDDVVIRGTDKMAAEAINGLFGARQFAPMASLHRPAVENAPPGGRKQTAAGRGSHTHRHGHGHKTDDAEKTIMLDLPVGCEAEPCQHDGDCYTDPSSPLGYACRCQPGYSGDFCEIGNKHFALLSLNQLGSVANKLYKFSKL